MRPRLQHAMLALSLAAWSQALPQQTPLPLYVAGRQVSGEVAICGSPQMAELLRLYEAGFHRVQPAVQFDADLKSTLTAVPGVATGHADVGLLGREIWPTETQAFTAATGQSPEVIAVATGSFDVPKATFALMVFVPRANPLASLTLDQLARIFGVPTQASGVPTEASGTPITTWGQLGLTGRWAKRRIHLYGFARGNDKSLIFSQLVFSHGQHWSSALHEFSNAFGPTSTDAGELILRAVAADPDGIGISNIHYAPSTGVPSTGATPGVRALALSTGRHGAPIRATRETVAERTYPLTRTVYMVLNPATASAATTEFLRFVLSRQGAQAVAQEGNYLPLTPAVAGDQLRTLSKR